MWYGVQDLVRQERPTTETDLRLRNQEFWALRGVDLSIQKGQAIGLIGRNGSGKTTLMRLISGIIPPTFGKVETAGKVTPIFRLRSGMHPHYTGRDYIYLQGAMHGMDRQQVDARFNEIVDFAEMEGFINAPLGTYSSGMKARLAYAIAIASRFDLLIIDEALAVGDTDFRRKCIANLKEISREKALVFVSHNMDMVADISNTLVVLDAGRKILETPDVPDGIEYYYRHIKAPKGAVSVHPVTAPLPKERTGNMPANPLPNQLELVSLHIPKTAGTSFRAVLERVYGKRLARLDIRHGEMLLDGKQFLGSALPSGVRAVHGHFMYRNLEQAIDMKSRRVPVITWLRHPVQRVLSNYFYLSARMGDAMNEAHSGTNLRMNMQRSLIEFARTDYARNRMSRFLEGIALEDLFFIGIVEHMDEDLVRLASMLGWPVMEAPKNNITGDYPETVPPEVLDEIAQLNADDMALYNRALDIRYGNVAPNPSRER